MQWRGRPRGVGWRALYPHIPPNYFMYVLPSAVFSWFLYNRQPYDILMPVRRLRQMGQGCGAIPQIQVLADVAVDFNYVLIQKSTFEPEEMPMKNERTTNRNTNTKTIKLTVKLSLRVLIAATFLILGSQASAPFASIYY